MGGNKLVPAYVKVDQSFRCSHYFNEITEAFFVEVDRYEGQLSQGVPSVHVLDQLISCTPYTLRIDDMQLFEIVRYLAIKQLEHLDSASFIETAARNGQTVEGTLVVNTNEYLF